MSDVVRLLHPEVEIIPGQEGAFPSTNPYLPAIPLPGSAIVRVTNTTSRNNSFAVRLVCEQPFWQESWYTVTGIPLPANEQNEGFEADKPGPQKRSVIVFVPRGGTRDVLIRFALPKHPNSRAGRYAYAIEVEAKLQEGQQEGARRKDRLTVVPAIANVRPFYDWHAEIKPLKTRADATAARVGFRRKSADFEVTVQNSGNDWLYCDLKLPQQVNLTVEAPTLRLAVRPPDMDETLPVPGTTDTMPGTLRVIPVRGTTGLRNFRGVEVVQQMPLALVREDAPSVPYPPNAPAYNPQGSVIAVKTAESMPLSGIQAIAYHPPIPEKLAQFPSRIFGSLRTMVFFCIGLLVLVPMTILLYHRWAYQEMMINPLTSDVKPGDTLPIRGKLVRGAKFELVGMLNGQPWQADLTSPDKGDGDDPPKDPEDKQRKRLESIDTQLAKVKIPEGTNGFVGKLIAHQFEPISAIAYAGFSRHGSQYQNR